MSLVHRTAAAWLALRFERGGGGGVEESFARLVEQCCGDDAAMQHLARIVDGAAAPERFDVMPESAGLRAVVEGVHAQRPGEDVAECLTFIYDALLCEVRARIATGARLETNPLLDPASGLPNRLLFLDRLQQSIIFAHRHNTLLAICSVRIDPAPALPYIGLVAAEIADRLRNTIRELDTVGRLALDEFGIVVNDLRLREHADVVVTKVAEILHHPYDIGERARIIAPRIGISFYPRHGHDAHMLLERAREASATASPVGVFGESAT